MIQARFYVAKIEKTAYGSAQGAVAVAMQAVTRGDQNATWAAATPSGTVTLQVSNPSAAQWFETMLGKDVDVRFEQAAEA